MTTDVQENGIILDGLKFNLDSLKFIFKPANYKKNIYRARERRMLWEVATYLHTRCDRIHILCITSFEIDGTFKIFRKTLIFVNFGH